MNSAKLLLTAITSAVFITAAPALASPLSQCPNGDYACIMELINKYSEGAGLPLADTLYRALDSAGRLDAHELIRYGRVKSLLGQYRDAARIFCRAAISDNRLEYAAMGQMGHMLADADSADKAAAIRTFERCALASPNADTAVFRNWLADFCGRQGLYEQEISLLTRLHTTESPSGRKLIDAARKHFSARRYRLAVSAAAAAYGRADEPKQRTDAAFVAHRSYLELKVRDSALIWLKLSEVNDRNAQIQAVTLNQETGRLEEAAALIDSLPASLSKDTLAVRQLLFAGEPVNALNTIMTSKSAAWKMAPRERMLWRGRCMIFSGQIYEAIPVLDSMKFMPSWHAAAEALRYKYWTQKLDDNSEALDIWGKLEYVIYTGNLTDAARLLKGHGMTGEIGEMLAVRLARILAQTGLFAEALSVLETAGSEEIDLGIKGINKEKNNKTKSAQSPEYMYFKAEMLNETGRTDEARALANKILADYPLDIFAQKARILLSKI
ncbi:MAG: hypothetical protein FWC23_01615 [Chitinispirillia bacterium]|nr:hypothetical protein [Chitinispirillia bacterium]MCL2267874.1 hypothetical protein [Chitinispirillia bacterium]